MEKEDIELFKNERSSETRNILSNASTLCQKIKDSMKTLILIDYHLHIVCNKYKAVNTYYVKYEIVVPYFVSDCSLLLPS